VSFAYNVTFFFFSKRTSHPSALLFSFVVHHTQQISMAAVAGDAERNINKQARKMRTNWVTNKREENSLSNKQTATDGFLRSAAVEGARTA